MIMPDGRSSYSHSVDSYLSREFAAETVWIENTLRRQYLDTKSDAELSNLLVATAEQLRERRSDVERYYNGGNRDAWRQNQSVLDSMTSRVSLYAEVAAQRYVQGGAGAHPDLKDVIEQIQLGMNATPDSEGDAVAVAQWVRNLSAHVPR